LRREIDAAPGVMQLVPAAVHNKVQHYGGMVLWYLQLAISDLFRRPGRFTGDAA